MKLKAIYNAVILKPYEFEEELHGNIIFPLRVFKESVSVS